MAAICQAQARSSLQVRFQHHTVRLFVGRPLAVGGAAISVIIFGGVRGGGSSPRKLSRRSLSLSVFVCVCVCVFVCVIVHV